MKLEDAFYNENRDFNGIKIRKIIMKKIKNFV